MKKAGFFLLVTASVATLTFFCLIGLDRLNRANVQRPEMKDDQSPAMIKAPAAADHHAEAQMREAGMRYFGLDCAADAGAAFKLIEQAAKDGYAPAQCVLGAFYGVGEIVDRDEASCLRWLNESAKNGYAPAQLELAMIYFYGFFAEPDYASALPWLKRLSADERAKEYGPAMFLLSRCYARGLGCPPDDEASMACLKKSAAANFSWADYVLFLRYTLDVPEQKDRKQALAHLVQAATGGVPEARIILGLRLTMEGDRRGLEWLERARAQGLTVDALLDGIKAGRWILTFHQQENAIHRHLSGASKK
jgi:hypothetical protein